MTEKTPRHGHDPIPMRRRIRWADIERPGDYCFSYADDKIVAIWLAVPTGRRMKYEFSRIPITGDEAWQWDGNKDSPTLTPSVHAVGHWHGWVRAGELVEA